MSDYCRQRAVQKEAVLEVLTESLKDSEHQKTKQELQELAYGLENEAFLCSNSEINKEYRGKLNGIKVKLKGEKGSFLRGVLLDGIFNAKDFMVLDINQVNDDKIELLLKSKGVTFDRSKYRNNKSPQKIPLPKINVKLNQGQEIQSVLQEQLIAEVVKENNFEEIQQHQAQEQNEIHNDDQIQSNILKFNAADDNIELIDEQQLQSQKDQLESELQNEIEENTLEEEQQNKSNISPNQNQIELQYETQEVNMNNTNNNNNNDKNTDNNNNKISQSDEQLIEQDQANQNQEVEENVENMNRNIQKNNYGEQDPDVDLSQHKICENLLTNMESNKFDAFPSQINEQIGETQSLKLKNKELEILVNFLKEELNKQQKYNEQLIINQKKIYLAEIDQLKQQLHLAKTTYQISTEQVEINKSFQERQDILKQLFTQCQSQVSASNVTHIEHEKQELNIQNIALPQEQNLQLSIQFSQILVEQPQNNIQAPQVKQVTQEASYGQPKKVQRVRRNQEQPKTVPGSLFD